MGIGTTAPDALLHLKGALPEVRGQDGAASDQTNIQTIGGSLYVASNARWTAAQFSSFNTVNPAWLMVYGNGVGAADAFSLHRAPPSGGALSFTEFFKITNAGRVGIGISLPTEKLDVAGNVKVSGTVSSANGTFTQLTSTTSTTETETVTGNLSVGGSLSNLRPALGAEAAIVEPTLKVDTTNRRVGIRTSSPLATLTVNENLSTTFEPSVPAVVLGNAGGSTEIWQGSSPTDAVVFSWVQTPPVNTPKYARIQTAQGQPLALQDTGGGKVGIGTGKPRRISGH